MIRLCRTILCSVVLVAGLGWSAAVIAAPEPAVAPQSYEFDFRYDTPELIPVTEIDGSLNWYWFMAYKVTNRTGEDRLFIPDFTIVGDNGEFITAGQNVPASAFDIVQKRLNRPLLVSPIDVVGKTLQGNDFAKESVVIWPQFRQRTDFFDVYVAGLSGETARVFFGRTLKVKELLAGKVLFDRAYSTAEDLVGLDGVVLQKLAPIDLSFEGLAKAVQTPDPSNLRQVKDLPDAWVVTLTDRNHSIELTQSKSGAEFLLRKTLQLRYQIPGVIDQPQSQAVVPISRRWVMR